LCGGRAPALDLSLGGHYICLDRRLVDRLVANISLRYGEWNYADGHKQQHVRRATDEVRFDGVVVLFFHLVFPLFELWIRLPWKKLEICFSVILPQI
jgi:hypothetical protein